MSTLPSSTMVSCVLSLAVPEGMLAAANMPPASGTTHVYVGTYSEPNNPGIHVFDLDTTSGRLHSGRVAAQAEHPSFLALHPNRRLLYAVDETPRFDTQPGGGVTAFEIDPATGTLRRLNARATRGEHPCHLSLDRAGRFVFVANYSGGSLAVFPLEPDGRLGEMADFHQHTGSGPNTKRQEKAHAHGIYSDPQDRFVLVPDLGIDRVVVYRFDAMAGKLAPAQEAGARLRPGSGPRHLAFDPRGRFVYVVNELTSTVTAHRWDSQNGTMPEIQEITTLPIGFANANTTAEIEVHPSGQFVYASNRGHDSLALFRVDEGTGRLTVIGHQAVGGRTPRNFAIDPTGRWLLAAHQDSNTIQVFRIDPDSGRLTTVHGPVTVPKPVCLRFLTPRS